jgi:hypothetical protein
MPGERRWPGGDLGARPVLAGWRRWCTNPNAILSVIFLPGNLEGFVLTNNGGGRYSAARPTTSWSVPPQIFVRSNFGGASPTLDLQ